MKSINLDEKWTFRRGYLDSVGMLSEDPGTVVNLPHAGMKTVKAELLVV